MSLNFREINSLGNIIDDTFGRSRDVNGSFKVLGKITGEDRMQITCITVVNLLNRSDMKNEADKAFDQLNKACNEFLKDVKKQFKAASGRALKTKELGHNSSTELMSMSAYSPKGTALIRCVYNFDIS